MANLHWIPRQYMSYWAIEGKPHPQSSYVWFYDKQNKQIKQKDPINIACKPTNIFMLDNTKGIPTFDILEKKLASAEQNFYKVFNSKIKEKTNLNPDDIAAIAIFATLLIFRRPAYSNKISSFIESVLNDFIKPDLVKNIKNKKYSNQDLLDLQMDIKKETGKILSIDKIKKEIDDIDKNTENVTIELTKNKKLSLIFNDNINKFSTFFANHKLIVFYDGNFITGDIMNYEVFPLSKNYCICLKQNEIGVEYIKTDEKMNIDLNNFIANNCDTFIIANDKNLLDNIKSST